MISEGGAPHACATSATLPTVSVIMETPIFESLFDHMGRLGQEGDL